MVTRPADAARNNRDSISSAGQDGGHDPDAGMLSSDSRYQGVPGTGSPLRWLFSGIWLVYLIQPVSELFGSHHGAAWIVGGLVLTVAFCAVYLPVLMFSDT